ncbi:hypothetical protein [Sorangium sp. So ce1000]|uniref:hypothetical protein n=1 Tax=Sorangium sp. So ce1000 TaxID=3133325 RepID=UPI003F60262D
MMKKICAVLILGSAVWVNMLGCTAAEPIDPSVDTSVEDAPSGETAAVRLPAREPIGVIPASPSTLQETGVVGWKMFDDDPYSFQVFGVDAADNVMSHVAIRVELSDQGEREGVTIESAFPARGMIRIAKDGAIVESTLPSDEQAAAYFKAMEADMQGFQVDEAQRGAWACTIATLGVTAACGGGAVRCAASAETVVLAILTCANAASRCSAAMPTFMCECFGKC